MGAVGPKYPCAAVGMSSGQVQELHKEGGDFMPPILEERSALRFLSTVANDGPFHDASAIETG